jgi:hypothetical protein
MTETEAAELAASLETKIRILAIIKFFADR